MFELEDKVRDALAELDALDFDYSCQDIAWQIGGTCSGVVVSLEGSSVELARYSYTFGGTPEHPKGRWEMVDFAY